MLSVFFDWRDRFKDGEFLGGFLLTLIIINLEKTWSE